MRRGAILLLLAGALPAQDDPFPGGSKTLQDGSGRITVEVPKRWSASPISGNIVLRASGRHSGGHDLLIVREEGQADVDAQRDRYLSYDQGRHAGAEFKKVDDPFYGYRMNVPGENRVVLRSFLADGDDGLVVSCSSRLKAYDRVWAKQVRAVVASVAVEAKKGGGKGGAGAEAEERRVFDETGIVSVVAPGRWKSLEPKPLAREVLFLGLKGSRDGPVLRLLDRGDVENEHLVITTLATQWQRDYGGGLSIRKLDGAPPRIVVANRKPGWIDYAIAVTAGGRGYALVLSVRKGSFEKYRAVADRVARSVVFLVGGYREPTAPPGDVHETYRSYAVLHAPAAREGDLGAVERAIGGFFKLWRRAGAGYDRKAAPLHVFVVAPDDFSDHADGFGSAPACYNPRTNLVVVAARPEDAGRRAAWTGRLYAALARATLDRDLGARCPPWLRSGLVACLEAAGRSGERPDARHPAYVDLVVQTVDAGKTPPLHRITGLSNADFVKAQTPDDEAFAWAYTHAMMYGRGQPRSTFRRWLNVLEDPDEKVTRLEPKDRDRFDEDFLAHVDREWRKK